MDASGFRKLKAWFDELAALPADERARRIASEASLDDSARRRLHALFVADARLAGTTARVALTAAAESTDSGFIGRRIGAFKIDREIGRGGMGRVFLAHRADGRVEQKVALKLIRPELLDGNTLARFRLERQVLALLKHPQIATLLDLGETDEGAPYVVMEFVEGEPITDYCTRRTVGVRARLRLFLDVCDAVAYAHRSMVVHRDLKPGNILVTPDGHVKLLDFGIAKSMLARLGTQDVSETNAAQRFFSPSNAAPEQLRGEPVTVACDVYGLGVLLYELIAGVPPFDFTGMTPGAIEHTIVGVSPVLPSVRVRDRALRGDLDAIVATALRKRPIERYSGVDQLADDVRRFLAARPVRARKGQALYRASRFVRRNRIGLAVATGALVASVVGGTALLRARFAAQAQRVRADQMSNLILSALESVDVTQSNGQETSAREIFERVADQAMRTVDLEPHARADVMLSIAGIDLKLGLPAQASALFDRIDLSMLETDGVERALNVKASALIALGEYDKAYAVVERGSRAASGPEQRAAWSLLEATLLHDHGKIPESIAMLVPLAAAPVGDVLRDRIRLQLATAYDTIGKQQQAYDEYASLLADQRARLKADDPALIPTLKGMARTCLHLGRFEQARAAIDEAATMAERLYGQQSLRYIQALRMRQSVVNEAGDLDGALAQESDILQRLRQILPEQSPQVARSLFNLAELSGRAGHPEAAERHYHEAIAIAQRVWLPEDVNNLLFPVAFSCFLIKQGRAVDAAAVANGVLQNVDAHPALGEYDVVPLAMFAVALGEYDADRTIAKRAAAAAAFARARDKAESRSTRRTIEAMAPAVAKMGVRTDGAPARDAAE